MNYKLFLALTLFTFVSTHAMDQDPYKQLREHTGLPTNDGARIKTSYQLLCAVQTMRRGGEGVEAAKYALPVWAKLLQDAGVDTVQADDMITWGTGGMGYSSFRNHFSDIFKGQETIAISTLTCEKSN